MQLLDVQPITKEPALIIKRKKIFVVADLHIGIEKTLSEQGINTSSLTYEIQTHLISLIEKFQPMEIIILGDIKHNIPSSTISERRDVKNLVDQIQEYANVHIVPGNHDGNIRKISSDRIIIHPSDGVVFENLGFVHGHRWPNEKVMRCDQIIIGHTHPTVMFIDRLKYRTTEPCWIKGNFIKNKLIEKYSDSSNPDILIMPAFNRICGGIAVNKEGIVGPLGRIIDIQNSEIYLLDGSYIGKVKNV